MIPVAILVAALHAGPTRTPDATLRGFRWSRTADTIHIDLLFEGGRPRRQRIGPPVGKPGAAELRIDLEGARIGDGFRRKWPRWMEVREDAAGGTLGMRIRLGAPTPWKARWVGDSLRVDLVDDVRSRSLLTEPLVLGGLGAAAVAGGVVLWLGSASSSPSAPAPAGDDAIPPPDVVLPR